MGKLNLKICNKMGCSCTTANLCKRAERDTDESECSYTNSSTESPKKPRVTAISNLDTNDQLTSSQREFFQPQKGYEMRDDYTFPYQKTVNFDTEEPSNNSIYR